jgi:hypothetical protein
LNFSLSITGMDRPSTITLRSVVPGNAFEVRFGDELRMFQRTKPNVSSAAAGSVAPLPFQCRFGKGGKLR